MANSYVDKERMIMAIEIARQCVPVETAYNVGALMFSDDGELLTSGYSRELPGNTHAEENCLTKYAELYGTKPFTGTLYTTMEPCSIRLSGKTSCSELLIKYKVPRVVIAVHEPARFVANCTGIEDLRKNGICVDFINDESILNSCMELNAHLTP
jgi:pyrimidine deaminase RibD-like protein